MSEACGNFPGIYEKLSPCSTQQYQDNLIEEISCRELSCSPVSPHTWAAGRPCFLPCRGWTLTLCTRQAALAAPAATDLCCFWIPACLAAHPAQPEAQVALSHHGAPAKQRGALDVNFYCGRIYINITQISCSMSRTKDRFGFLGSRVMHTCGAGCASDCAAVLLAASCNCCAAGATPFDVAAPSTRSSLR